MTERYEKDGYIYTKSNHRLVYTPELHYNHFKAWTVKDLIYLCGMWERRDKGMRSKDIALCLGRTVGTCASKVMLMKRNGEFKSYADKFND